MGKKGADFEIEDPHERVKAVWDNYIASPTTNYDTPFHAHLQHLATSTSPSPHGILSTTLFLFTPSHPHHSRSPLFNTLGSLHGGATATLFDLTTSIALAAVAAPGRFQFLGVTRTLNVTYLAAVTEGMTCVVGNEVVNVGGRLAVVRGWIREVDEAWAGKVGMEGEGGGGGAVSVGVQEVLEKCKGRLLAVCEHGKVNTDPPIQQQGKKERGVKL